MPNKIPKIIVLAGGRGTRLPIAAKEIPKVLVKIQGKPLLAHQLEMLKRHGFHDVRFSLGFRADQVIEYLIDVLGGKYEYVIEDEPLGTGGAIKKASEDIKDDFMVLNGDILSDIDLARFWQHHQSIKEKMNIQTAGPNPSALAVRDSGQADGRTMGTIAVWPCPDCRDFGLIRTTGHQINEFLEKPKEQCGGLINAGFYILSPEIFKDHPQTVFSVENDIFPKLAQEKKLFAFVHNGQWIDVGTEERLKTVTD